MRRKRKEGKEKKMRTKRGDELRKERDEESRPKEEKTRTKMREERGDK